MYEMNKALLTAMVILSVIAVAATLLFSVQHSKKLVKEKEQLILKSDSLHILELKAKKELMFVQIRLDSFIRNNKKNPSY